MRRFIGTPFETECTPTSGRVLCLSYSLLQFTNRCLSIHSQIVGGLETFRQSGTTTGRFSSVTVLIVSPTRLLSLASPHFHRKQLLPCTFTLKYGISYDRSLFHLAFLLGFTARSVVYFLCSALMEFGSQVQTSEMSICRVFKGYGSVNVTTGCGTSVMADTVSLASSLIFLKFHSNLLAAASQLIAKSLMDYISR